MAETGRQEKEYASTDPVGDANATHSAEPVATEPLQTVVSDSDSSSNATEKKERPFVDRTLTTTTTRSSVTVESKADEDPVRKPWYKSLNPLKKKTPPPIPKERIVSREYNAGLLSRLTWQWMAPIMHVGYQRPLELNDIWLVNPNREAGVLAEKLGASFKRRAANGDRYPLLWAMHETFYVEFWIGGFCQLFASIFQVMSPFTLRYLISFATQAYVAQQLKRPPPDIGRGIGLVLAVTFMQILQSLGTNHFIYRGQMVGAQARGVLITLIFEKAMKLSGRAKAGGKAIESQDQNKDTQELSKTKDSLLKRLFDKKFNQQGPQTTPDKAEGVAGDGTGWPNGRIVNLMSVDTYRIDQASGMFHMTWTSPIAILITLVVLLINLTYSALAGFALLVIGIPVLTKAIKTLFKRRRAINKVTDQRVSLTQEVLQSVRFVKYFGWETSFLERIKQIRKREIRSIQILLAIRNAINAVSMSLPIFASMLSFITYSLSQHILDPAPIFSSLALFNSLRLPLNLLPLVIGQVIDAWASISRIQEFLLAEEQADDFNWDMDNMNAAVVQNADFTWERTITQDPDKNSPQTKKQIKEAKKASTTEKVATKAGRSSPGGDGADSASTLTSTEPFELHGMDFTLGRNELVAVIGGVGSGKSSLLAALAGDMRRTTGHITMGASRAFCPQYAWIQNATVRQNIVFGKDYERRWYDEVVDACALRPDCKWSLQTPSDDNANPSIFK
ncbi:MAG: hypothetical protein Q9219_004916 [cf. Caloplaca sp. 3 TL-2023]